MELIAITGGIGSGKSVVSHMMKVMGYDVYDCDSRARGFMTGDQDVRRQLISTFGKDIYLADGNINREHLSSVAFADKSALNRLNAIVHPATARDLLRWSSDQAAQGKAVAFVDQVQARIDAQALEDIVGADEHELVNDNARALLPQVMALLQQIKKY